MPGFYIHNSANDRPDPIHWPLAASQSYQPGDPVGIVSNALQVCPTDGTKVLDTELIGFAAQGAYGEQAQTDANLTYGGGTGGPSTGAPRSFYPATPALLLRTKNFWAAGAPGTNQAKTGSLRGNFLQMSATSGSASTARWGVENSTGVIDTDAVVQIVDVLDENMNPIGAGDTLTAGDGYLVFRVIGNNQWAGGVATVAS